MSILEEFGGNNLVTLFTTHICRIHRGGEYSRYRINTVCIEYIGVTVVTEYIRVTVDTEYIGGNTVHIYIIEGSR